MAILNYRDPGTGEFIPFGGDPTPIGSVFAFGGSVAPAGWHLCDGTLHGSVELLAISGSLTTPDLRDRFIVGAGASYAVGTTGGAASVALTAAQSGSQAHTHPATASGTVSAWHTHSVSFGAAASHTHDVGYRTDTYRHAELNETHLDYPMTATNSSMTPKVPDQEPLGGSHSHSGTSAGHNTSHIHGGATSSAAAADSTAAHENRPPYYALVYIVKVA